MVFSSPQWTWRKAYEPVDYGFVRNTVAICPERGREREVHIVVPTELFQFLPAMFGGELEYVREVGAEFYADQEGKRWVLGIQSVDGRVHRDLWAYTQSQLPPWLSV